MNLIDQIIEPKRLILAWQPPQGEDRKRRAVGELLRDSDGVQLRYLLDDSDFAEARQAGFSGFPAFKIGIPGVEEPQHANHVLGLMRRRLPPRSRADFTELLQKFRLAQDAVLSDFALLGYTEARLPGDGFSIVNDYADASPPFEFVTEVAGFRFYDGMKMCVPDVVGHKVELEHEPSNKHDKNAVRVNLNGNLIGYINRIQAPAALNWLEFCTVEASIDRINGTADMPRVYLFIKVRSNRSA